MSALVGISAKQRWKACDGERHGENDGAVSRGVGHAAIEMNPTGLFLRSMSAVWTARAAHGGCEEQRGGAGSREGTAGAAEQDVRGRGCERSTATAERKNSVLEAQRCSDGGFEIWFGLAGRGTRLCTLVASELFCKPITTAASRLGGVVMGDGEMKIGSPAELIA
ncbi:hypothetical protein M0R45_002143 [Rubus argutus]|uniref:Uncharacterized protein n=1 Tax=Rubus argutus TaxID=59490 RepID=A0AAW1VK34_RUBAR